MALQDDFADERIVGVAHLGEDIRHEVDLGQRVEERKEDFAARFLRQSPGIPDEDAFEELELPGETGMRLAQGRDFVVQIVRGLPQVAPAFRRHEVSALFDEAFEVDPFVGDELQATAQGSSSSRECGMIHTKEGVVPWLED